LIPVMLEETYWGFVCFADFRSDRNWSESEESILQALAAGVGGKIRRHKDEETFHTIVEGTSGRVGNDFFNSLVRQLALALPVHAAFVSEFTHKKGLECRTLATWKGGESMPNVAYSVESTPCEDAVAGMMSYYPEEIQALYPKDKYLVDIGAESYAAVPCFDSESKIIGHLAVMDDKPLMNQERTMSILKLFGSRAGAEMERKRTEETIKKLAYHDPLTGLPNRMLLNDRLTMGLAHSQRNKTMLAVLFIDFDGFKKVNDTLGHAAGDELLREVARRLKGCLRRQDTVARLGGDEFILLLSEIHSSVDAARLAEKLIILGRQPVTVEGKDLHITFSIGISLFPDDGKDDKTLMQHADEALYEAKNGGKDRYQFYKKASVAD
ncbi:MAG: sensor domain-containing diguanylate cyclase, partial [Nitrospinaceae bacterium]